MVWKVDSPDRAREIVRPADHAPSGMPSRLLGVFSTDRYRNPRPFGIRGSVLCIAVRPPDWTEFGPGIGRSAACFVPVPSFSRQWPDCNCGLALEVAESAPVQWKT